MVRDELDVLPYTLVHLLNEGVDHLIVADNLSTDGTWEWLNEFAAGKPITLLRDEEVGYYQSRKMTRHYQAASAAGADWVIPFDADEVWYCETGSTLAAMFGRRWEADCLEAKIYNHFPTSHDAESEPNPFLRILHRDPAPSIMTKTAARAGIGSLVIEQGNHRAHADHELRIVRPELAVGHFPWRSPGQFERKVRNGGQAYAAATDTNEVPLNQGEHWRQHGQILAEGGPEAIWGVYDEWYHDPPIDLDRFPAPWRSEPCAGADLADV
jgi:glycosyltransferase involved in cell wall biosynthesis